MDDVFLLQNISSLKSRLGVHGFIVYWNLPVQKCSLVVWGFCTLPDEMNTAIQYGAVRCFHTEPDINLKMIQATEKQIENFRRN